MLQFTDPEVLSNKQSSGVGGANTWISLGMGNRIGFAGVPWVRRDGKKKFL